MRMNKAFTLIEILIVVGILGVISAATIPTFVNYSSERGIDRVAQQIVSDIQLVRNKSLSGAYESSNGVNSDYWVIRFGCNANTYDMGLSNRIDGFIETTSSTQKTLPTGFTFRAAGSPENSYCSYENGTPLVFTRLTGKLANPRSAGAREVQIRDANGATRTITVYENGNIKVN